MSQKRKTEYVPKRYESKGRTFVNAAGARRQESNAQLYESMLESEAFMDLTARQKILYVYVKAQLYGHRKPKQDYKDIDRFNRDDLIYFAWKSAQDYGLYKSSEHSNFYKDMRSLISHGFIEKYAGGNMPNEKSVYRLSDKWQMWVPGTDYSPTKKAARNPSGINGK